MYVCMYRRTERDIYETGPILCPHESIIFYYKVEINKTNLFRRNIFLKF